MNKEELKKLTIQELNWLVYYATLNSRIELDNKSPIYDQLISIGYVKRSSDLWRRCASGWIKIKNKKLEDFILIGGPRNHENDIYTPIEVWLMLYPESFNVVKKFLLREIGEDFILIY